MLRDLFQKENNSISNHQGGIIPWNPLKLLNRTAFLESSAKRKHKAVQNYYAFPDGGNRGLNQVGPLLKWAPLVWPEDTLQWSQLCWLESKDSKQNGVASGFNPELHCLTKFDLGQVIHLSLSPVIHKAEITMYVKHLSYYPPCSYSVNAVDMEHLISQLTEFKLGQKKSLHLEISASFVISTDILHKISVEL